LIFWNYFQGIDINATKTLSDPLCTAKMNILSRGQTRN